LANLDGNFGEVHGGVLCCVQIVQMKRELSESPM
jgi:hypothetical protein